MDNCFYCILAIRLCLYLICHVDSRFFELWWFRQLQMPNAETKYYAIVTTNKEIPHNNTREIVSWYIEFKYHLSKLQEKFRQLLNKGTWCGWNKMLVNQRGSQYALLVSWSYFFKSYGPFRPHQTFDNIAASVNSNICWVANQTLIDLSHYIRQYKRPPPTPDSQTNTDRLHQTLKADSAPVFRGTS